MTRRYGHNGRGMSRRVRAPIMEPRVSIGLPVYNGERYIVEALDSIVSQTFADFELVISDNASTDGTARICEEYASRDGRIAFHRNETNRGAAWNYNRVFALSRGEYFKWASHDDRCAPTFLERCVAALDANPEVVIGYPRSTVIDAAGDTIEMEEDDLPLASRDVVRRFAGCLNPMKLCHNVIFGLMRRSVLAGTQLIGTYLASDRCLVAELSLHGPFEEIPERLFYRRKHSANIGVALKDLQFYRPGMRKRFVMPEWRLFGKFMRLVRKSRLPAGEKVRLHAAVLRWAAGNREEFSWQLKAAVKGILGID
jgi:glycosyltransferase involved in cell wall biosynthesis